MAARLRIGALLLALAACSVAAAAPSGTPPQSPPPGVAPVDTVPVDRSVAGLFNSANAYARQGKAPLAILDYERARIFAPADPDILTNLHRVRAGAGLADSNWWLDNHARLVDPDVGFWVGLAGVALAAVGILASRFSGRRRLWARTMVIAGIVGCSFGLADAVASWPLKAEAVVMQAATVRVTPAATGDTLFALAAGELVRIEDTYGEFVLIQTDAGRSGWVSRALLTKLI